MEQQQAFNPPRVSELLPPDRSKFPSMSNTLAMQQAGSDEPFQSPIPVAQQQFRLETQKYCRNPSCPFGCEPQPLSSFHLSAKSPDGHTSLCKTCKVKYDAKYKAGRQSNIDKNTLRVTAPNKDLYLVQASQKINDCKSMYVLSELELNTNILRGNIKDKDVVIKVKTVSRKQVRFEMVDI